MSLEDGTVRAIQGKEVRRPEVQDRYDSDSSDVAAMKVSTTQLDIALNLDSTKNILKEIEFVQVPNKKRPNPKCNSPKLAPPQSVAKRYKAEPKLQNRFEPLFNKNDSEINTKAPQTAEKIPPFIFQLTT